jgi:DNA-binding HxlR family transcriptional regulator
MKVTTHCPVETTLSVIGGKWKPLILWHLSEEVHRFLELQRLIPGITRKMLTQHLRELERDGVVGRKVYSEVPARVEYSLTRYGMTLRPLLRTLCEWGHKHESKPQNRNRANGENSAKDGASVIEKRPGGLGLRVR